jgi:uncharacterized Fe-S cluster-containing radical SAM superfamily enzyme
MSRRQRRPLDDELQELEQQLATLTLRVATLRNQVSLDRAQAPRPLAIGDRVSFNITGRGRTEGVIIGTTARRVQIRQDITSNIISRAPHNVALI